MEQGRRHAAANKQRLSEKNVLGLRPRKGKQYLTWDSGTDAAHGLAVLVSPSGVRSYRAVYYFPGSAKPHWRHLGRVGEMTLAKARELTRQSRGLAREGIDPRADDAVHSDAFGALVERYTAERQIGKKGNKSAQDTHAVLLYHGAEWLKRPVATIRGREIEHLLLSIRDGGNGTKPRPAMALRLYAHLKDFFAWAARPNTGSVKSSPMLGVERPVDKIARRERAWFQNAAADNAIRSLWSAADKIGGDSGRYLKCMLLLGKRKTALAAMKWEEIIDQEGWYWNAPPSNSKKKLFSVPLSNLAQRVLGRRQEAGAVFAGINLDKLQRQIRDQSDVKDFFWHGLRHLMETKLADLHVAPHIRDLLLDHVPTRGSGAVYDHAEYRDAMREAVERWAKHVEELVTPQGAARLR